MINNNGFVVVLEFSCGGTVIVTQPYLSLHYVVYPRVSVLTVNLSSVLSFICLMVASLVGRERGMGVLYRCSFNSALISSTRRVVSG